MYVVLEHSGTSYISFQRCSELKKQLNVIKKCKILFKWTSYFLSLQVILFCYLSVR